MATFFFIENGAIGYTLKVNSLESKNILFFYSLKSCQISIECEGTNIKNIIKGINVPRLN